MPNDFSSDTEFQKLLARRSDVDLAVAALEFARDFQPGLDFGPTLEWIAGRAGELAGPVARAATEFDALRELCALLAHRHGLYGEQDCYEHAEGSFLNRVVETRRGLPITLAVLYMAVAQRAGLELSGVATPMHFLTRHDGVEGPWFVDGYYKGRIMSPTECVGRLHALTGVPKPQIKRALGPVEARTVIVRMLNNLKALFARQDEWRGAWLVQRRLAALEPAAYRERRDLALIAVRAQQSAEAIELLERCLKTCPDDETPVLKFHLNEARSQLARWN